MARSSLRPSDGHEGGLLQWLCCRRSGWSSNLDDTRISRDVVTDHLPLPVIYSHYVIITPPDQLSCGWYFTANFVHMIGCHVKVNSLFVVHRNRFRVQWNLVWWYFWLKYLPHLKITVYILYRHNYFDRSPNNRRALWTVQHVLFLPSILKRKI